MPAFYKLTGSIIPAIGAIGVHGADDDSFSTTVRGHDANGELYDVLVIRTTVTVSGNSADGIPATIEN